MQRFFNTTGPCDPRRHYMLPPEERLPGLQRLVDRQLYFVLHAARQTGKTTAMRAFAERLRSTGHVAVWATLETSRGRERIEDAEPLWLSALYQSAVDTLPQAMHPPVPARDIPAGDRLRLWIRSWAVVVSPAPLVLLLDEADVVRGEPLISLLGQLRAGFAERPERFAASIALIGMRDLRDYITASKGGAAVNPGSPFNIKAESITLRNFSEAEVGALCAQHTEATGQAFTPEAIARVFWWTRGQPYLVNKLAAICVDDLVPERAVEAVDVDRAKEILILARHTHLDNLAERLREPRVAAIIEAVLTGDVPLTIPYETDDFQYVVDLGLLIRGPGGAEAANPIYREVLARQVSYRIQESLVRPWWPWQTAAGKLDFPALVDAFRQWWRENAEALIIPPYPEAVPHIALMAFLQRVVNGGGQVHREFSAGRGAMDLLVTYAGERFVVEIKRVRPHDSLDTVRRDGLKQLAGYLDTVGEREGWLMIFDQRPGRTWEDRLWSEDVDVDGRQIRVRGA